MFEFTTEEKPPFLWTSLEGKLISDDDAKNLMDNTSQFISKKTNTIVVDMKKLNYISSINLFLILSPLLKSFFSIVSYFLFKAFFSSSLFTS